MFEKWCEIINLATFCSMALQPSQPLLPSLNLSNTSVSFFPDVEEFFIMLDGFALQPFCWICWLFQLRQFHAAHNIFEARVGAQRRVKGIIPEPGEEGMAFLESRFQPSKGLILFTQGYINLN